jgi:hypothetical protein
MYSSHYLTGESNGYYSYIVCWKLSCTRQAFALLLFMLRKVSVIESR